MIQINLSDRTALVTGAAGGLGAEMARVLARAGAAVIVNYHRNAAGAEEVAAEIQAEGGRAMTHQADVSEPDSVSAMADAGRDAFGPITLVVNNAGREERLAPPQELSWDDYQRMIDLNLKAIYNTLRATHADMAAAHWGRIVNIGSVALNRPFPGSTAYVAAKGAMLGATRGLAAELGKDGITVNMVAPGWIPVARHASASPEALERLVRETALGRQGTPSDVASAALFFCSDLAAFVTGTWLPVNGGHTILP